MRAGLYVHVPFCRHRCHFCAFLVTTHTDFLRRWEAAVVGEIAARAQDWPMSFDTVYFGGGTPSVAPPGAISRILGACREVLDVTEDAEVTLEANPGDLEPGDFAELRRAGINRVSLGIQSTSDEELRFLTRTHTFGDAERSYRAARAAGITNITIDLLYGLPERTRDDERRRLEEALDLEPDHVSAYQLTFEKGTPFRRFRDKGALTSLSEEEERARFLLVRALLDAAGYSAYEVSNFARSREFESRHNWKYWSGAPYLGVGPAAHSFDGRTRWWNLGAVRKYVRAVEEGRPPVEGTETPSEDERRLERLFLGLRTAAGARERDLGSPGAVADLIREGLARVERGRVRLTESGFALADGVASRLG